MYSNRRNIEAMTMKQEKNIKTGSLVTGVLLSSLWSGLAMAADPATDVTTDTATDAAAAEQEQAGTTPAEAVPATDDTMDSGQFVVDTSNYKCEECPFEEGYSGEIELGVGNVSDDSFKFGEYNGLNEQGAFAVANAKLRYRNPDAHYLDLSVRELGLDSRSVSIEGGRQGSYSLFLNYDEITRYVSDSVQTPYLGNGTGNLTLPAGWVPANSTAGMTQLNASLQNVDVDTKRKRLGAGASFIPASDWKYDIKVRHETREGNRRAAGAFFFTAAELIEPIDYVTNEVDVSASYIGKKWQATLAYYGSFFSNDITSLTWENAFDPPAGATLAADTGQRALPPDNKFHQVLLSAGYQYSQRTRISGDIAVGRMEQNEQFLPASFNASLTGLPRTSADAQVDTLVGDLRFISALSDDFRINASYSYSDHDNTTPQAAYDWVTTDAYTNATTRTNQPYSFTRQRAKLGGDYRVSRTTKTSAGVDYERYERTLQEVDDTNETTVWGKLTVRAKDFTDMTFKLARAERNASGYHAVAETDPPQNPLLRKYNMADRTRTSAGVNANSMLSETASLGISLEFANDDYTKSTLGLTSATEGNINVDSSVLLSKHSSMHMFVGRQRIESSQAGGQSTVVAQWNASNVDTVDTAGIGIKRRLMSDKLDVGVDYIVSRSVGKVSIDTGGTEFPELKVTMDNIKLYADYQLKENMTVHGAFWYERYNSYDWALDGVDPATINNVLSFGEDSPDYKIGVVTVTLRYKF